MRITPQLKPPSIWTVLKKLCKKDAQGRETDRVKSHNAKLGECKTDTSYTDTKYDPNRQPTEQTTQYSDGRQTDHETWFRGPSGIGIHEKNGQMVYDNEYVIKNILGDSATLSDDRTNADRLDHSERGQHRPDEHTKHLIEQKERELHEKYGVAFSKPGAGLELQEMLTGKHGEEIHARYPTMLELNAIEKALEKSDSAYRTADGHAVKFSFADKQFHDGPPADADSHFQDSGADEIRIFPQGVADAHGRTRPLESFLVHELAHNTIFKKDKMGGVMPSEITDQIGFYEVPDNPAVEKIVRGELGTLWTHMPGNNDRLHWWTPVDAKGQALTTDGKPPNEHNVTTEAFGKHHINHLSLIEAKDGSYYSHQLQTEIQPGIGSNATKLDIRWTRMGTR